MRSRVIKRLSRRLRMIKGDLVPINLRLLAIQSMKIIRLRILVELMLSRMSKSQRVKSRSQKLRLNLQLLLLLLLLPQPQHKLLHQLLLQNQHQQLPLQLPQPLPLQLQLNQVKQRKQKRPQNQMSLWQQHPELPNQKRSHQLLTRRSQMPIPKRDSLSRQGMQESIMRILVMMLIMPQSKM